MIQDLQEPNVFLEKTWFNGNVNPVSQGTLAGMLCLPLGNYLAQSSQKLRKSWLISRFAVGHLNSTGSHRLVSLKPAVKSMFQLHLPWLMISIWTFKNCKSRFLFSSFQQLCNISLKTHKKLSPPIFMKGWADWPSLRKLTEISQMARKSRR